MMGILVENHLIFRRKKIEFNKGYGITSPLSIKWVFIGLERYENTYSKKVI